MLNENEALSLFQKLGLKTIETLILKPRDPIPDTLAWPVAAKVLSADVPHKTEVGGVVLNLHNAQELAEARARILEQVSATLPEAHIEGVAVQPMAKGLAEALVGYCVDPEVGPTITVAMGGVLAEIYEDTALELAPVDHGTARAMIERVKGLALIRGYRRLPHGDVKALAQAVVALSRLASLPQVQEAEINPLLVKAEGEGVVALDGLVRLG
jgi:succinyl-CoA synthetase beta subunit